MTSPFPNSLDNDATLPLVVSNITQIGGQAINALRDATFAIESNIGLNAQGSTSSIATRLNRSLDPFGALLPSVIASIPALANIVNSQVSPTAGIQESKLALNFGTSYLNNLISNVNTAAQTSLSFISNHGYKLEPHIDGSGYNHVMAAILVAISSGQYFNNASGGVRNNTNLYDLFNDINDDLITHEVANGTPVSIVGGYQIGGTLPLPNYAHVSAGIYVDPAAFVFIPSTVTDVQSLADFIDSANVLLIGTRIQTLYANGIPVNARAAAIPQQTLGSLVLNLGQRIVAPTPAQTYLLYGSATAPVDSIDHGDDLIEFLPSSNDGYSFDAAFNLVKPGDIVTVLDGYGLSAQRIIREIKYAISGGSTRYVVRINGKNFRDESVTATINKPLFNNNKSGVLALAQAGTPSILPSTRPTLIAGCPRGAEVLSVGFDPGLINSTHYLLYLSVYPDGNPLDKVVTIPPIDISGNAGIAPGSYTLDGVVETINNTFRTPGYNNRFMAFQYNGELGIKMTDSINNISFTVIDGVVNSSGLYDLGLSHASYVNNAIGVPGLDVVDATGFGQNGAGVSSPAFSPSYASSLASLIPTKVWCPLSRKTFDVNGVERESFSFEPFQLIDGYGDGYWPATIITRTLVPGVRVEVTYQVPFDLSSTSIEIGKTITAIAGTGGSFIDDGRYIISGIQFNACGSCLAPQPIVSTNITVYDAIQSPTGNTPYASALVGTPVFLYFSSDSISFNAENASDWSAVSSFKRSMEVYVNQDGYTFSQERGRMNITTFPFITLSTPGPSVDLYSDPALVELDMVSISPKLRGYAFNTIDKINLTLTSFDATSGVYSGYLCKLDVSIESNQGPTTVGKRGNVVRFYDSSYVEYVDIALDIGSTLSTFSTTKRIDIQLFPTLELDEEVMLLGTAQVNESTFELDWLQDRRQFGNVSVEQLTTSALNYIAAPTQMINENGIIRGFNVTSTTSGVIQVDGGTAIVNGNIVQLGAEVITIPVVVEVFAGYPVPATTISTITWYLCVNQAGELELVASTDFDPFGAFAATYAAAGVDQTRMFFVSNPTVANAYPIRATYFSDLVLNNRDVTPIAIISATTSGSPASITSISAASAVDARRFITNGYSGLTSPFVLSTSGSFRSITSLNNWLIQLANWNAGYEGENFVGTDVIVKGNFPITSATTLSFLSQVRFIGDGGVFNITTPTAFNLGNHVSFDGITFNYNYDPLVSGDAGYVSSDLVNATNNQGCLYCNVLAYNDISIKSCTFNWVPYTTPTASTAVNRYPFIYFAFASLSGGNGLLEGIEISNNIFNSQVSGFIAANQVDIRAAIAFIMQVAGTPSLSQGVQLVNCNILNNVCYQDQMIILSSILSGGSLVEAITTINTSIRYNQCGTIGFITRYYYINDNDNSFNFQNSPGGRNPSITISNNTCKLIDALDSTGTELTNSLVTDSNMTTGASIIENNTVSWIKVLVNQPSSPSGPVPICTSIIKNNNLFAYYLTPSNSYIAPYNASYASNPPSNAAIYVINSATTTPAFSYAGTTGSVIIEGNTINNGMYTHSASSSYTYDFGIYSEHNAIISNNTVNTLGAVLTASPTGIVVAGNVSSSIQNNTLNRNGVHWNLYINCFPANIPDLVSHPIITHNTFDSTTVDGSSNVLVGNLPVYAFYSENINQTAYAIATLLDDQNYIGITPTSNALTNPIVGSGLPAYPYNTITYDGTTGISIIRVNASLTSGNYSPRAAFLEIGDGVLDRATTGERNYSKTIILDKYLPNNVKILHAKIGIFLTQNAHDSLDISSPYNNQFSLTLLSYSNIQNETATLHDMADVKNTLLLNTGQYFDNSTTDAPPGNDDVFSVSGVLSVGAGGNVSENELMTATRYCAINTSAIQSNFITGQNNSIIASFDMNWLSKTALAGGDSTLNWFISPILIKYQW